MSASWWLFVFKFRKFTTSLLCFQFQSSELNGTTIYINLAIFDVAYIFLSP